MLLRSCFPLRLRFIYVGVFICFNFEFCSFVFAIVDCFCVMLLFCGLFVFCYCIFFFCFSLFPCFVFCFVVTSFCLHISFLFVADLLLFASSFAVLVLLFCIPSILFLLLFWILLFWFFSQWRKITKTKLIKGNKKPKQN